MATDIKKHTSPAPGETPSRAQLAAMILSANDAIPVANATERAQVVNALNTAGVGPTTTRPVLFSRGDAPGLHRLEYTYDGAAFIPLSGTLRFASTGDQASWTTTNSGLLAVGDESFVGSDRYTWSGSAWLPAAWTTYAPTVSGCTATADAKYRFVDGLVCVKARLAVASMSSNPGITLPVSAASAAVEHLPGAVALIPSAGSEAPGVVRKASTTAVIFFTQLASGSNVFINNISGSTPINFAGATIATTFFYEAA